MKRVVQCTLAGSAIRFAEPKMAVAYSLRQLDVHESPFDYGATRGLGSEMSNSMFGFQFRADPVHLKLLLDAACASRMRRRGCRKQTTARRDYRTYKLDDCMRCGS